MTLELLSEDFRLLANPYVTAAILVVLAIFNDSLFLSSIPLQIRAIFVSFTSNPRQCVIMYVLKAGIVFLC